MKNHSQDQACFLRNRWIALPMVLALMWNSPSWAHKPTGKAQQNFAAAYQSAAEGNLSEAVDRYEAGLKLEPKNAMAHYFLGDAYRTLGNVDQARGHFNQSLLLDPKGKFAEKAKEGLIQIDMAIQMKEEAAAEAERQHKRALEQQEAERVARIEQERREAKQRELQEAQAREEEAQRNRDAQMAQYQSLMNSMQQQNQNLGNFLQQMNQLRR